MQVIHAFDQNTSTAPSVVTIGTFDGVHVGHQQLIRTVIQDAHAKHAQSVVIGFHPHPRSVLGRGEMQYLTLPDEKAEAMQLLGVDTLLIHPFTVQTSQTPAAYFVEQMATHLRLKSLWVGPDFAMGHKRQGNAEFLAAQGALLGFTVNIMPELSFGAQAVSSTRIRAALQRGDVREANLCLGRPFSVRATPCGTRTLCVAPEHALPANGNYAVLINGINNKARIEDRLIQLNEAGVAGDVKVEFV